MISLVRAFENICGDLGVPLARKKTEGSAASLTFLGIQLNTVPQTHSLPGGKLLELIGLLKGWRYKTRSTLQSLGGALQFAAKCVPESRLFTCSLIIVLKGHKNSTDIIWLDRDFNNDPNC